MEISETHAKITQDNEKTGCRSTYFSVVLRRIYEIILVIFVSLFVEYSYISIRRATNTIIYILHVRTMLKGKLSFQEI